MLVLCLMLVGTYISCQYNQPGPNSNRWDGYDAALPYYRGQQSNLELSMLASAVLVDILLDLYR